MKWEGKFLVKCDRHGDRHCGDRHRERHGDRHSDRHWDRLSASQVDCQQVG